MNFSHNQTISQLNSEKNQLLILVNAINEGVVVVSKDGQIVLSNNEFNKMFEVQQSPDGRPYWEVIRISEITNLIESALETRQSTIKEISIIYPYEKFYFVNIITLDPPQDEIIAIFYDITEFKNLEKIKAELIANVSHELRTPLTAIKGYVETLEDEAYDSVDEKFRFINIIKKHTQRLIDIVSDLLVLSEIEVKESEKTIKDIQEFDKLAINSILLSCYESLKSKIGDKKLIFKKELEQNLPQIRGNQFLLEQAFINLLDNAIKYTPENGTIGFKTRLDSDKIIIKIFDSGIGIPKDSISRIFERFYRVDKDRSRKEGGTGLGLSIVKHAINIHSGEIKVESEMGKGTNFIINLPID
jgi:signal transduction histidine kinase